MLAGPTRMNRCLPRLITSSTTWPVRSTVAYLGTRTSQRVKVLPTNASRRIAAVCQTVSPSGICLLCSLRARNHLQRDFPQPLGVGRVERIRRHTTLARPATPVDDHCLVAVLEIATAHSVDQWRS